MSLFFSPRFFRFELPAVVGGGGPDFASYPQYFAAVKLFENIKAHLRPKGDGKGGIYFGATGCGKSYTNIIKGILYQQCKTVKRHL